MFPELTPFTVIANMRKLDIAGPKGNAFVLAGIGKDWFEQIHEHNPNKSSKKFVERMMSGDYNHLVRVFHEEFKYVVELVSDHEIPGLDKDLYTIEENPYV